MKLEEIGQQCIFGIDRQHKIHCAMGCDGKCIQGVLQDGTLNTLGGYRPESDLCLNNLFCLY